MEKNKNIYVFCSSSDSLDYIYYEEAEKLGKLLAENNHNLVYGGSRLGLMNAVAKSASVANARIIGVVPKFIFDSNITASYLDELIVTADIKERKQVLRDKSDAYIALPGGFGTMEELMELITLKQLLFLDAPIVIVNFNGYYDALKQQFEFCFEASFAKSEYQTLFCFVDNSAQAIDYIQNYTVKKYSHKWN